MSEATRADNRFDGAGGARAWDWERARRGQVSRGEGRRTGESVQAGWLWRACDALRALWSVIVAGRSRHNRERGPRGRKKILYSPPRPSCKLASKTSPFLSTHWISLFRHAPCTASATASRRARRTALPLARAPRGESSIDDGTFIRVRAITSEPSACGAFCRSGAVRRDSRFVWYRASTLLSMSEGWHTMFG